MKLIANAFKIQDMLVFNGMDGYGWSGCIITNSAVTGLVYENNKIPGHMVGEFNLPGLSNKVIIKAKYLDTFYRKLENKINKLGGKAYTRI